MQTTCHKTDLADNLSISSGHQMSLSSIFSLERDPLHQVLYINNFLLKKKKYRVGDEFTSFCDKNLWPQKLQDC